ncbi:MAG: hypothetical protein P8176_08625 [Gammaproteobacteria bacterium]
MTTSDVPASDAPAKTEIELDSSHSKNRSKKHSKARSEKTDSSSATESAYEALEASDQNRFAQPAKSAKYVMVIDSDATVCANMLSRLEKEGLPCEVFTSFARAVKTLMEADRDVPGIIFVGDSISKSCEDIDGLALVKYIKKVPRATTTLVLRYGCENGEFYTHEVRTLGAVGQGGMALERVDLPKILHTLNGGAAASEDCDNVPVLSEACDIDSVEVSTEDDERETRVDAKASEDLGEASGAAVDDVMSVQSADADTGSRKMGSRNKLVKRESLSELIHASASNDAESFREHSSVIAYFRSLEREDRHATSTARSDQGAPQNHDSCWRAQDKRDASRDRLLSGRFFAEQIDWEAEALTRSESGSKVLSREGRRTPGRWFGVEFQRLELQSHLDQSLEQLQAQVELDMIRQTGTIQDAVGDLMDAQTDAIKEQLHSTARERVIDRWLRIVVITVLLFMPSVWLIMQFRLNQWEQRTEVDHGVLTPLSASTAHADTTVSPSLDSELSQPVRTQLIEGLEVVLNQPVVRTFDEAPLNDAHAQRLQHALNTLSAVGFHGVITVTSRVSPYCVQYGETGDPELDVSDAQVSDCYLWPANVVAASAFSQQQSVAFADLLAQSNLPESSIQIRVVPVVAEADFWSQNGDGVIDPAASGEVLSAAQWNVKAAQLNKLSYRISTL